MSRIARNCLRTLTGISQKTTWTRIPKLATLGIAVKKLLRIYLDV